MPPTPAIAIFIESLKSVCKVGFENYGNRNVPDSEEGVRKEVFK